MDLYRNKVLVMGKTQLEMRQATQPGCGKDFCAGGISKASSHPRLFEPPVLTE